MIDGFVLGSSVGHDCKLPIGHSISPSLVVCATGRYHGEEGHSVSSIFITPSVRVWLTSTIPHNQFLMAMMVLRMYMYNIMITINVVCYYMYLFHLVLLVIF